MDNKYPYFLFAAIHHLKSSPTFSVRPRSLVGRVTVDLFRRSWVRFRPRSKDFFFASCGSLIPFTRANAQWDIHGFTWHFNLHFRVNSLFHYIFKKLGARFKFAGSEFSTVLAQIWGKCSYNYNVAQKPCRRFWFFALFVEL